MESMIKQTYTNWELIAVDDGSTDHSWDILMKYKRQYPKQIKIFRHKKNLGESVTANDAFKHTKGTLIARMDADDVSKKDRIEKEVAYLLSHPTTYLVGSQATVINAKGKKIGTKHVPLTHEAIYQSLAYVNPMIHPSIMFRRSLLPQKKSVYHHEFESTDDYQTYFELIHRGQFANLAEPLVSYRIHGTNKSLTNMKEKFWTDTKLRIAAITRYSYHAPLLMFPAIIVQSMIVTLLPEQLLREVFLFLRGMREYHITIGNFALDLTWAKLRQYALRFS